MVVSRLGHSVYRVDPNRVMLHEIRFTQSDQCHLAAGQHRNVLLTSHCLDCWHRVTIFCVVPCIHSHLYIVLMSAR